MGTGAVALEVPDGPREAAVPADFSAAARFPRPPDPFLVKGEPPKLLLIFQQTDFAFIFLVKINKW